MIELTNHINVNKLPSIATGIGIAKRINKNIINFKLCVKCCVSNI